MTNRTLAIASPGGLGGRYHGPGMALSRVFRTAVSDGLSVVVFHGQGPGYQCDFDTVDCGTPRGAMQAAWAWRVKAYLAARRGEVALLQTATLFTAPFLAALAARALGIPAFGRIAALCSDIRVPSWGHPTSLSIVRRKLLNRLDGIVALSRDIRQELLEAGVQESKIFLIPNPVNTEVFRPASADERNAIRSALGLDDSFVVAGCGSLISRKGAKEAVEAIGLLNARSRAKVTLIWIGPIDDEEYNRAVLEAAVKLGIKDRIKLYGYQSEPSRWLRAADAFILPSANEGMPNSLLEAMACGLPALVTPVSGARDVISDGHNGIFIDRNPEMIMEALARLMADPGMRNGLGANAKSDILAGYTPTHIWRRYADMYAAGGVRL